MSRECHIEAGRRPRRKSPPVFYFPDFAAEADADSWSGDWYRTYTERFDAEPAVQSLVGYIAADLTVKALEGAGPDVTLEKVLAALEAIDHYEDPFGGPSLSFSPTKHQGGDYLNVYQVVGGEWVTVDENVPY